VVNVRQNANVADRIRVVLQSHDPFLWWWWGHPGSGRSGCAKRAATWSLTATFSSSVFPMHYVYVDPVNDNLVCGVCGEPFQSPRVLPCGHT